MTYGLRYRRSSQLSYPGIVQKINLDLLIILQNLFSKKPAAH